MPTEICACRWAWLHPTTTRMPGKQYSSVTPTAMEESVRQKWEPFSRRFRGFIKEECRVKVDTGKWACRVGKVDSEQTSILDSDCIVIQSD